MADNARIPQTLQERARLAQLKAQARKVSLDSDTTNTPDPIAELEAEREAINAKLTEEIERQRKLAAARIVASDAQRIYDEAGNNANSDGNKLIRTTSPMDRVVNRTFVLDDFKLSLISRNTEPGEPISFELSLRAAQGTDSETDAPLLAGEITTSLAMPGATAIMTSAIEGLAAGMHRLAEEVMRSNSEPSNRRPTDRAERLMEAMRAQSSRHREGEEPFDFGSVMDFAKLFGR